MAKKKTAKKIQDNFEYKGKVDANDYPDYGDFIKAKKEVEVKK